MSAKTSGKTILLDLQTPIWERVFTVSSLVLVGSRDPNGGYNLAPKHMAFQLGWENYFGFVCTPNHSTYQNIKREKVFTVSYARPEQLVLTSLAAGPRDGKGEKPSLEALPTTPASTVDGVLVENAYLLLECELTRIIDGFGKSSLITGRIVAAQACEDALRRNDQDSCELIYRSPLLAYLYPSRYALIRRGFSFPFPRDFKR